MAAQTPRHPTVMDPDAISVAEVYAQALLSLCGDVQACEDVAGELVGLASLLNAEPDFDALLSASLLSARQRTELVKRIFVGRASDAVAGLLVILAQHDRMNLLRQVGARYRRLLDVKEGKVEVQVTTAGEMDDASVAAVMRELSQALGGEVLLQRRVNPDILGGMVIRVGDRVYDASIKKDLDRLSRSMLKT